MNRRNDKSGMVHEAIVILCILALLLFIFRLWPLLVIVFIGFFVAAVRLLFLSTKEDKVPPSVAPEVERQREPTEHDLSDAAYCLAIRRISELVADEYPEARWIWENSDAAVKIMNGEDVTILLNRAGGFRKATVHIRNLRVSSLSYQTETDNIKKPEEDSDCQDDAPENYELIAFQWVDAHTLELNTRCNEAIGQGNDSLLLGSVELPIKESWADICTELKRVGIAEAECTNVGIRIKLTQ